MGLIFLFVAALFFAIFIEKITPASTIARPFAVKFGRVVGYLTACFALLSTSFVKIPSDHVGIVNKIYGSTSLPQGHIIATNGETGYQAEIIPPGALKFSPFFNILNTVLFRPVVVVPNGFYGRVVTTDGEPLGEGEVMAKEWPDTEFSNMLDAQQFLTHGGKKGLQLSILKPGSYPLNLALYTVRVGREPNQRDVKGSFDDVWNIEGYSQEDTPLVTAITRVPAGSVGVVRSTVQSTGANCAASKATTTGDASGLVAELVPQGCKGVWNVSLPPNDYYLNRDAYDVTLVSTRVTTLEFKGGFTRRYIDLKVDAKGDFQQSERSQAFPTPTDAADSAVVTKVEGWEIPQELRAIVQITPENAPIVVAAVGGQDEVDRRIVVPAIRSHVRNVYGSQIVVQETDAQGQPQKVTRSTRVLDTIDHRAELEQAILDAVAMDGKRAGVAIKEIRLGESAVPPELLLARQREQLAGQLKAAYQQEQKAQEQRQETEKARATADQQSSVVTAQISVQTARLAQDRRQAEGHAERLFLEEQAAGQQAQTNVIGKDNVIKLQALQLVLDTLKRNPEILGSLKLPQVYVDGSGGGLNGPAAIMGSLLAGAKEPAAASPQR